MRLQGVSDETTDKLIDAGINRNTIRLSIGTEHIDDIIADLENGFAAIRSKEQKKIIIQCYPRDETIVALLPDSCNRYYSTPLLTQ